MAEWGYLPCLTTLISFISVSVMLLYVESQDLRQLAEGDFLYNSKRFCGTSDEFSAQTR